MNTRAWRHVKLLAGLHAKGRVPCIDIVYDAVDAELAWAVGIADDLFAYKIVRHLAAPGLCPAALPS